MALSGLGQVAKMGQPAEDLKQELEATAEEVLGRLKSHQLFQSEWDIAAFAVFLTFVGECGSRSQARPWGWDRATSGCLSVWSPGTVVLLLLLVVVHCCCCCCCTTSPRPRKVSPGKVSLGRGVTQEGELR